MLITPGGAAGVTVVLLDLNGTVKSQCLVPNQNK